jgi:hypothetical protein
MNTSWSHSRTFLQKIHFDLSVVTLQCTGVTQFIPSSYMNERNEEIRQVSTTIRDTLEEINSLIFFQKAK